MRARAFHRSQLFWFLMGLALAGSASALPLLGGKGKPGGVMPEGFAPPGRVQQEDAEERSGNGLSANQAAAQAQSLNGGGRVLAVEEATGGWRVKLLKDGNVRFVFVPQ